MQLVVVVSVTVARNASPENKYIQSAALNGEPLNSPWFPHEAVREGRLVPEMVPRANTSWGIR
jgi:putative alpha-1,2-mannosidase